MRLVLLGGEVAHSRSPAIHSAALAHAGLTGEYTVRSVDRSGVVAAADELRVGKLDGANVTMPHKSFAATLCDHLDHDAALGRAANTLAMRQGVLVGWNTDVTALRAAAGEVAGRPVLILGAGGAAAAALVAFCSAAVLIAARRPESAARIAADVLPSARPVPWGAVHPGALVVNATPLGMHGEPLPGGVVEEASALIDLPYAPEPTPAVLAARRLGIPCTDGLEVLVGQAAESFRIWTGLEAPVEVLRAAARR